MSKTTRVRKIGNSMGIILPVEIMSEVSLKEGSDINISVRDKEISLSLATKPDVSTKTITPFCRRHNLKSFLVFGSILRDDFGPESDVDVIIEYDEEKPPSFAQFLRMKKELESMFGRQVDLCTKRGIREIESSPRRREILKTAREVYVQG